MAKDFVHLHVHSHYSINKGIARIRDLVNKAIDDGMPGMALTDLGNMFGIKEFHEYVTRVNKKRKANGEEPFKPILGCEMRVEPNYHIILLAKNLKGYENLISLALFSRIDENCDIPCIRRSTLKFHHEGLIVLSGGLSGEVSSKLLKDNISGARETIEWYHSIFGDDYYIELQRHEVEDVAVFANRDIYRKQVKVNDLLLGLAKEYGIKVVCTNDVHFVEKEQAEAHDRWLCFVTNKEQDNPERIMYSRQEWLKSTDEMSAIFYDVPETLANTIEILDKVEFYGIDFEPQMPFFEVPIIKDDYTRLEENEYLEQLTFSRAYKIYGEPLTPDVEERLKYELQVIKQLDSSRYFLILEDVIKAMHDKYKILVGPGRGSSAGSLVAYCLGITKIDPLKHDLLFERFANLNRKVIPDIDTDLEDGGFVLAQEYLQDKYGDYCCVNIAAYEKMDAKKSIKAMACVEGLPELTAERLCNYISNRLPNNKRMNLVNALECFPQLLEAETFIPEEVNTIKYAKDIEGVVHGIGIHACGLALCDSVYFTMTPVFYLKNSEHRQKMILCTQYDGRYVEDTGIVKFDFCILKILNIIKKTLFYIPSDIDLDKIPIDDPKTFELFQQGDVEGVFEFGSIGKGINLYKLHPTEFSDLVALYTFYLPGYEEYLPSFIARKNGREEVKYDIPCMERYLKETFGFTIYQEQIMHLSRLLANFTREESDTLRKALGKKKQVVIDEMKPKFIEGGIKNGHNKNDLEKVWADWEKFGPYAYCKSHAVCYTWLAYQTAYLKAHYHDEYMSAYYEFYEKE